MKIEYGSRILKLMFKNLSRLSRKKMGTAELTALNVSAKCCLLIESHS